MMVPEAARTQRLMIIRAAVISGSAAFIAVVFGSWRVAAGIIGGWAAASLSLWLMGSSLHNCLAMGDGLAKVRYLLFAAVRVLMICAAAILLLKWDRETGIGFCVGLSGIMLAAGSAAVVPITKKGTERK